MSIQRETTACQEALRTRWTGPTDFPRTDSASHQFILALGTLTTAIAKSAIAWGAVKRGQTRLEQHDSTVREVRRLCRERRREKEPLKRKSLSIALYRARQVMRRKPADLRFEKAVETGALSRLQEPHHQHVFQHWKIEVEQPYGWKICRDAPTLFTTVSRSSPPRCARKLQNGFGNDGCGKCCRPSTARG